MSYNAWLYGYANPINNVDKNGNTPWYINGWDDSYGIKQDGNTCAVVSTAVSLSILTGHKYTQADIQPFFSHTYLGIGVLGPEQAAVINTIFPWSIQATYTQGTRADLMANLKNGWPTIVTFTTKTFIGHAIVVIGFDPATTELQFFNPAYNIKHNETDIVNFYDSHRGLTTFDKLWASSNLLITNNEMVTIKKSITVGGGGNCGGYRSIYR